MQRSERRQNIIVSNIEQCLCGSVQAYLEDQENTDTFGITLSLFMICPLSQEDVAKPREGRGSRP
jgi:hypothetical protein